MKKPASPRKTFQNLNSLAIILISIAVLLSCKKEGVFEETNLLYTEIKENWSISSTSLEGPKLVFPVENGFIGLENTGKVSLFDLENGSPVWTFQSNGVYYDADNRIGLIKDNVFYFISNSYSLFALDLNSGSKLWSIELTPNGPVGFSNVLKLGKDSRLYTAMEQTQPTWETSIISLDLNGQNIDTIHTMKLGNTRAKVIDIAGEKDYLRVLYQENSIAANSPISHRLIMGHGTVEFRALEFSKGTTPSRKIKFIQQHNRSDFVQINNHLYFLMRGTFVRVGFESLYDVVGDGNQVYAFHAGNNSLQRGIHTFDFSSTSPTSKVTSVENQSFYT